MYSGASILGRRIEGSRFANVNKPRQALVNGNNPRQHRKVRIVLSPIEING